MAGNRRLQVLPAPCKPWRAIDAFGKADEEETKKGAARNGEATLEGLQQARSEQMSIDSAADLMLKHGGSVPLGMHPAGLATDDGGHSVFVCRNVDGHVTKRYGFNCKVERGPPSAQVLRVRVSDGALLRASAMPHTDGAALQRAAGLAVAAACQCLLVSDASAHCVHVLDVATLRRPARLTSADEAKLGPSLTGLRGALNGPHGLAVAPHDAHVYICDRYNHRVVVATLAGECVRTIGERPEGDSLGRLPGRFAEPVDVAVGRQRVYVAEYGNRRVQVLCLRGAPLQVLRLPGERPPRGLALSREAIFGAVAQRLWVSADRSGIHIVNVGVAALAPP